ncbi:MAG: branched-chain amino acid ABC transporter permease, partial [Anaerolineae bacterium]|nr:branched-chain amino acid ABC transporter permease [Anaerolineae bacterium]
MHPSPLLQEFNPGPAAVIFLWVVFWAVVGGVVTPRVYRKKDLDASSATLYGAIAGAGTGPILPAFLWAKTPHLNWRWMVLPAILTFGLLYWAFAVYHPANLCVASGRGTYLTSQVSNGILVGVLYGLIALGLTLIFSILGIVSFAHGQFYMIGGYVLFYVVDANLGLGFNPLVGLLATGLVTFIIGIVFEWLLLRPMHQGKVERPGEYAILLTFGLAFFLEYSVQATLGTNPRKASAILPPDIVRWLQDVTGMPPTRVIGFLIGLIVLGVLYWFLTYTWPGKALRSVSQDKEAAAVVGINPLSMNTLAFGLGAMLAGISGAALVQVFTWAPNVGAVASARSFVVIVLGGMGSL